MGQKITIKIAEKEFVMNAPSAQEEEDIRTAAAVINRKISGFVSRYPGRQMNDILSFVALNESISSIVLQRRLNSIKEEAGNLETDIENYLKANGK